LTRLRLFGDTGGAIPAAATRDTSFFRASTSSPATHFIARFEEIPERACVEAFPMQRDVLVTADREIRVQGVFDTPAAQRVEDAMARVEPDVRLCVDLTQVREFHDSAIAVLAHALTTCSAEVAVRGLRHHQIRMLRYFGVDTAPLEQDAVPGGGRA
jgi:STAS domain